MITKELVFTNELGMHARIASRVANEARRFNCAITSEENGKELNLKKVIDVIMIKAKCGDKQMISFDGEDEVEAAFAFEKMFLDKFEESR